MTPTFDQRPGLFEATREPMVCAVGANTREGWRVRLIRADGEILTDLDPGAAMMLSIDIAHAAGVVTIAGLGEGD